LTVNGVPAWREKMAQMPTGVAAACSSDMFKSPVRPTWTDPKTVRTMGTRFGTKQII
jgi:aromatic amino acid aminotransferase I